ncbi:MAG: oligopeptide transport system permease protein [Glaciecola sp.]|jgi:oligopeptide transport system permease protein
MGKYILRRVLQFVPVFLGATLIIFAMIFALPGDPIRALAGERPMTDSEYNRYADEYNLEDPFFVQYGKFVGVVPVDPVGLDEEGPGFDGLLQGNLGSNFNGRPVSDIIKQRLPITARLALIAFGSSILLGITAGILAAIRNAKLLDQLVLVSTIALVAIPSLVLGYVAQLVFGVKLGWFDVNASSGTWTSLFLPGMVLGSYSVAYIARLSRTSLIETLSADYVKTATSKGLTRRSVVGKHAMRNSLIPVVTYLGVDIGGLLAGSVIIEGIFNIPGLGNAVFRAILAREGFVVVGVVTFFVIVYMVASLLVDLLYATLDPRIRYE